MTTVSEVTVDEAHVRVRSLEQLDALMAPEHDPVILYFWGPRTCGISCGCAGPNIECFEQVAHLYAGEPIDFCKVDTQRHPELMHPFRIRAIPTYLFVLRGEVDDVYVGRLDPKGFVKRADRLLSRARGEGWLRRLLSRRPDRLAGLAGA